MIDKSALLKLLKSHDLAVLSTASASGRPESAVMAITLKDDFTLLMSTEPASRKVKNIQANPAVSVIVGGLKGDPSVQIDGIAQILQNDAAASACKYMLTVHPELKDYGIEDGAFIAITPSWARYMDYSKNPPEITEFTDL